MRHTILILDDVAEYVESLRNILRGDYDVVTAYALEEAEQKAGDNIDLYVVDVRLDEENPDNEDGIRFLEWVRGKFPKAPVVMMSAYKEYEARKDELVGKGTFAFLRKPITISQLKEAIREGISRSSGM